MKTLAQDLPHLLALTLSLALVGLGGLLLRQAGLECGELCVFGTPAESAMTGAALVIVGAFNLAASLRAR